MPSTFGVGHNGRHGQLDKLVIYCDRADGRGFRTFIATLGAKQHRDRFDADNAISRRKFRESLVNRFELDNGAHEFIEETIISKADEADAEPAGLCQPVVQSVASMQAKTVDWTWPGYIPAGALTGLTGNPGLGKSQVTCDLAARMSRGDCMPPQTAPAGTFTPRGVLMMNAEDDPARTIRPRLEAAGADLTRVHCLRAMTMFDGTDERGIILPGDLPAIESQIRQFDVGLVVLDPFVAFLDGELSVNNDADVRRCLSRLAAVAESTGAAVLLVRHLNKNGGMSAVFRAGGSIGITGACRAEFMVGQDPADSESRIFAPVKTNLGPEPASLRFHIESHAGTSRVCWDDACDVSANQILQAAHHSHPNDRGKLSQARLIIEGILRSGPRGSSEVLGACEAAGISERTYHIARKALGIKSERTGFGAGGQWLLTLPAANGCNDQF